MVYPLILVVFEICSHSSAEPCPQFLMGASNANARSKVAWKVIISPPHEGRLGLIEPMFQRKALLGEFVVRSMLPRNEP